MDNMSDKIALDQIKDLHHKISRVDILCNELNRKLLCQNENIDLLIDKIIEFIDSKGECDEKLSEVDAGLRIVKFLFGALKVVDENNLPIDDIMNYFFGSIFGICKMYGLERKDFVSILKKMNRKYKVCEDD